MEQTITFLDIAAASGIGVLVGIASGIVTLMLVTHAFRGDVSLGGLTTVATELLALAGFWFGGSWIGSLLLSSIKFDQTFGYYVLSLSAVYFVICIWALSGFLTGFSRMLEQQRAAQVVQGDRSR